MKHDLDIQNLDALEAARDQAQTEVYEQSKPWQQKREALEAAEKLALAPVKAQLKAAEDAITQARVDAFNKRAAAALKLVALRIPSPAEFSAFCNTPGCVRNLHKGFDNYYSFSSKPPTDVRAPKVPFLKLLAVTDGDITYYGAWNEKTRCLIAFCAVKPSRHPGDQTEAFAVVNGKEVAFEEKNYSITRPVQTFLAALRVVSEDETAFVTGAVNPSTGETSAQKEVRIGKAFGITQ